MDDFIKIVVLTIAGVFLFIYLMIIGAVSFDKSQVNQSCQEFNQQSGYETKYVEYTYWRYDCLAEQTDGRWISTDNIYFNTQK